MKNKQGWTRETPTEVGLWLYRFTEAAPPQTLELYRMAETGGIVLRGACGPEDISDWNGYWQRIAVPTPPGQADREEG